MDIQTWELGLKKQRKRLENRISILFCICEKKKESRRNPARIPPQTPPAGGESAEARRIHSPRQIVSPCLVRISIFNHLDFARKTFELCPTNTAKTNPHPRSAGIRSCFR